MLDVRCACGEGRPPLGRKLPGRYGFRAAVGNVWALLGMGEFQREAFGIYWRKARRGQALSDEPRTDESRQERH